jgi:hypothetical protein
MIWFGIVIIFVIVLLTFFLTQKSTQSKSKSYRDYYLQLVEEAEQLSLEINRISTLLAQQKNPINLDAFEGAVRMFENILVMLKELHPHEGQKEVIGTALYLVRSCKKKIKTNKNKKDKDPLGLNRHRLYLGCYFCSKPFVFSGLSRVQARFEGSNRKVYSCPSCKDELNKNSKVKVLHFMVNEKAKHWSEVNEYNPIRDFWHLNSGLLGEKDSRLRLIETRKASDEDESR